MDADDLLKKETQHVLNKRKIRDLLDQIDPTEKIEPEVENILLELADDFIYNVTKAGCQLAKHRNSDTLEVKDLQLHLETMYNIRIPGYASDDVKPVKKISVAPGHQQRLNAIKKAIMTDASEKEKNKVVQNLKLK